MRLNMSASARVPEQFNERNEGILSLLDSLGDSVSVDNKQLFFQRFCDFLQESEKNEAFDFWKFLKVIFLLGNAIFARKALSIFSEEADREIFIAALKDILFLYSSQRESCIQVINDTMSFLIEELNELETNPVRLVWPSLNPHNLAKKMIKEVKEKLPPHYLQFYSEPVDNLFIGKLEKLFEHWQELVMRPLKQVLELSYKQVLILMLINLPQAEDQLLGAAEVLGGLKVTLYRPIKPFVQNGLSIFAKAHHMSLIKRQDGNPNLDLQNFEFKFDENVNRAFSREIRKIYEKWKREYGKEVTAKIPDCILLSLVFTDIKEFFDLSLKLGKLKIESPEILEENNKLVR